MTSANVICKQLGFPAGAISVDEIGQGWGKIWLSNVKCTGSEQNIASCPHSYWGITYCTHENDVSITCNPGMFINHEIIIMELTNFVRPYIHYNE